MADLTPPDAPVEAPPRRRPGRPATGRTEKRNIRVGDVWDRCAALAAQDGETMTAFVTRALVEAEKRHLRRSEGQKQADQRA